MCRGVGGVRVSLCNASWVSPDHPTGETCTVAFRRESPPGNFSESLVVEAANDLAGVTGLRRRKTCTTARGVSLYFHTSALITIIIADMIKMKLI